MLNDMNENETSFISIFSLSFFYAQFLLHEVMSGAVAPPTRLKKNSFPVKPTIKMQCCVLVLLALLVL